MPLQNRVTPLGQIVADAARCTMMGNRGGRLHDPATRQLLPRRWASKAWICCVTAFGGRQRTVMGPGYTELFFVDEVTALAAGHRPCFECRRKAADQFATLAAEGSPSGRLHAPAMDALLHLQRLDGRAKRLHRRPVETLPDGAVVILEENGSAEPWAVREDRLLQWTFDGYRTRRGRPKSGTVAVATPPMMLTVLAAGYRPLWHPSCD